MDASGWPVVATHFTRRETNDGNGWRRLDIQKCRWNLARRDRHRARQGHRAQAAAHDPRQDQGGGERESQDEAGRIRAQGLHAELAVAAPHGLAGDLVPRAGRGQPASEQQAKLRERHRAAEQDSRRGRINSLDHKDMAAIQDGLKCYSPKTATITWSVLKNALEAARDENLIRRNSAKMVRPVSASSSSLKVNPPLLPDDG